MDEKKQNEVGNLIDLKRALDFEGVGSLLWVCPFVGLMIPHDDVDIMIQVKDIDGPYDMIISMKCGTLRMEIPTFEKLVEFLKIKISYERNDSETIKGTGRAV